MTFLLHFLDEVLKLLELVIVLLAIMSWLVTFGVVNIYNRAVRSLWDGVNVMIDPLLRPIRRFVPMFGGIDISPLLLILSIEFVRQVVIPNLDALFVRSGAIS